MYFNVKNIVTLNLLLYTNFIKQDSFETGERNASNLD